MSERTRSLPAEAVVVGVDISKAHLDVYIHAAQPSHARYAMEVTGGQERRLAAKLLSQKLTVAVVNPRQVRDFAKAKGWLAKTDRLDRKAIAALVGVAPFNRDSGTLRGRRSRSKSMIARPASVSVLFHASSCCRRPNLLDLLTARVWKLRCDMSLYTLVHNTSSPARTTNAAANVRHTTQ